MHYCPNISDGAVANNNKIQQYNNFYNNNILKKYFDMWF